MKHLHTLFFALLFLLSTPTVAAADGPMPVVPIHRPTTVQEPNRLVIDGIAGVQSVPTTKQVKAIRLLYHHIRGLKRASNQICPGYVISDTHLTFLHNKIVLMHALIQEGGCSEVIVRANDIRATDYSLDGLLNRAGVPTKPHRTRRTTGGYTPTDLQSAYHLPSSSQGRGQTVAIVDAYNDPRAEHDLSVYRKKFGLPPCTRKNHCFRTVNQYGGRRMPQESVNWDGEISLDIDMVSAACPHCSILLVAATSPSFADLGTGVDTAVRLGAHIVSNSYGSLENGTDIRRVARYYTHPGTVIVASSGDNGAEVQIPAALKSVIAVGGTTLTRTHNGMGWSETAWSGSGGGCSAYVSKPAWQHDTGCPTRATSDVSAVADPATGVQVFGHGQWWSAGGTSASAPIIAGVYALAGNATTATGQSLYAGALNGDFNDILTGSTGRCTVRYLCNAVPGYDGPTGNGTPNGIGAF